MQIRKSDTLLHPATGTKLDPPQRQSVDALLPKHNPLLHKEKPRVLTFTDRLLPASNTFIRTQMESLKRFEPYYVGLRYCNDISLSSQRSYTMSSDTLSGALRVAMFRVLPYSPGIYRHARRISPRLIHAHFGPNGALCLWLQRTLKVPLVVTFHGYDATTRDTIHHRPFSEYGTYLRRRQSLIQHGDLFIAVSHFIQGKLVEQGFPIERIRVHYIGIDTDFFRPNPHILREPVVLFVARLMEKKGGEYLVRAFAQLRDKFPKVRLVIIGDGPLLPNLKQLALAEKVPCNFLGKQPTSVVKEWLNKAMVLCAPSVTAQSGDSEGLPIVILEAHAMGLPVVSTVHAGIPEAVIHGETGFLVAERDERGLAECLEVLLDNHETWTRFHDASMVHVRKHFDLKRQTALLEDIYESLLHTEHR